MHLVSSLFPLDLTASDKSRFVCCPWVSGALILYANIIKYPSDLRVESDMQLASAILRQLELLAQRSEKERLYQMHALCSEIQKRAREAIQAAENRDMRISRRKRPAPSSPPDPLPEPSLSGFGIHDIMDDSERLFTVSKEPWC